MLELHAYWRVYRPNLWLFPGPALANLGRVLAGEPLDGLAADFCVPLLRRVLDGLRQWVDHPTTAPADLEVMLHDDEQT